MKLELDFTNKTITIVEGGSINEFLDKYYAMKGINLEDWRINSSTKVEYVPIYPTYPTYEITCASTTAGCGCTDKCNTE